MLLNKNKPICGITSMDIKRGQIHGGYLLRNEIEPGTTFLKVRTLKCDCLTDLQSQVYEESQVALENNETLPIATEVMHHKWSW